MKTLRLILLTVLALAALMLFSVQETKAQVTLLAPADGATLSPEPTFAWRAAGPYNLYLFISVFSYDLCGPDDSYYRVILPMRASSFEIPTFWWTKLGRGTPCYWAVLGINTTTHLWALSDVFTFTRGADPPGTVPDTGIDECYDWDQMITCPFPDEEFYGQDAQYTTNPMSFAVSPDRLTVTDNVTGLVWQRKDDDTLRRWADASSYCENLNLGGYTDWRLPTEYELQTILDYGTFAPAIDEGIFPETDASVIYGYWASRERWDNPDWAWAVSTYNGYVETFSKTNSKYVRCVRGEPRQPAFTVNPDETVTDHSTGLMWQQSFGESYNWPGAHAYCENLCLGGHDDWRLPDVKELRSLVDPSRSYPAIDDSVFPGTEYAYHTSSTSAERPDHTYYVHFHRGGTWSWGKGNYYHVRCVRGR